MKLGDAKRQALVLMREWTIDGQPIGADSVDYLKSMDDLANIAQTEIARRRKIPAVLQLPWLGGEPYANMRVFTMPLDFLEVRRVEFYETAGQPLDEEANRLFRWISKKEIGILESALFGNWFVYYYRLPTPIVVNLSNEKANDNYEFEVDADVQYLIPFFMAAQLLMDENVGLAITKLNEYQSKLDGLFTEGDFSISQSLRNPSGW